MILGGSPVAIPAPRTAPRQPPGRDTGPVPADSPGKREIRDLRKDMGRLADDMRDAFACIRRLDRLRPTCVICLDATADRQTSRGPACTDCVGDLPDDDAGPDPEVTP